MKLENNKGITLVVLIITIIVMIIIAGITVYSGSSVIREAKKEDVKTNMLLIQAEIKNYVEQAKFENKEDINWLTVNGVTLNVEKAENVKNGAGNTVSGYYRILNSMTDFNLKNLENPEQYLISYDINKLEVDVYFLPGVTDSNGSVSYKLSEIQ